MANVITYLRQFNFISVLLRLLLALISGAAIGYGRELKKANAGLRTYIITSIGAALTILISMYENEMLRGSWSGFIDLSDLKFDGSRFAAQVINGIGFLAAGTIIAAAHRQVSGLTSAIGLFAAASLGIAAGAGFYECVIISVLLIILTMELLQPIEIEFKRRLRNINIYVEFESIDDLASITDTITEQKAKIFDIEMEQTERTETQYPSAILTLKLDKNNASHSAILSSVAELGCVCSIQELIA